MESLSVEHTLTNGPNATFAKITGLNNYVEVNQNRHSPEVNPVRKHLLSSNHSNASFRLTNVQNRTHGFYNYPFLKIFVLQGWEIKTNQTA